MKLPRGELRHFLLVLAFIWSIVYFTVVNVAGILWITFVLGYPDGFFGVIIVHIITAISVTYVVHYLNYEK